MGENVQHDRNCRRAPRPAMPSAHHPRAPLRSHSATWAGCIVSATTRLEVGAQPVELDLLAQPRAERIERPLRVVAAAVEAPVDEPLDRDAQRAGRAPRRRASSPRSRGSSRPRTTRTRPAPRARAPTYAAPSERLSDAVDERRDDHAVDVVEAVAQDRDRRPRSGRRRSRARAAPDSDVAEPKHAAEQAAREQRTRAANANHLSCCRSTPRARR